MTVRILMVDDQPDAQMLFRQNFRREIRKAVYSFDVALSGEAALEVRMEGEPPKVVPGLSDIDMPGMSGIELLEEVRHAGPESGGFMIIAYGDNQTEARVRDLSAERFLTKPVDFGRLKENMSRTLEDGA